MLFSRPINWPLPPIFEILRNRRTMALAPLLAGTAIYVAFISHVRGNEQQQEIPQPRLQWVPDVDPKDYKWKPRLDSEDDDNDPLSTAAKKKASEVYTSIPLKFITVATKRIRLGTRRSNNDPWKAAIFHTGWNARKIIETAGYDSPGLALRALSSMLDNKELGEHEWTECPPPLNAASTEVELIQKIKRLACIVERFHTPSDYSVALKRLQKAGQRLTDDRWAAGLWQGSHEGFVEEFMCVGQMGEFDGVTRVEALGKLKGRLDGQRC